MLLSGKDIVIPSRHWVALNRAPELGDVVQSITVWLDEDGTEKTQVVFKDAGVDKSHEEWQEFREQERNSEA